MTAEEREFDPRRQGPDETDRTRRCSATDDVRCSQSCSEEIQDYVDVNHFEDNLGRRATEIVVYEGQHQWTTYRNEDEVEEALTAAADVAECLRRYEAMRKRRANRAQIEVAR